MSVATILDSFVFTNKLSVSPSIYVKPAIAPKLPPLLYWSWVSEPAGIPPPVAKLNTPVPSVCKTWPLVPVLPGKWRTVTPLALPVFGPLRIVSWPLLTGL